MDPWVELKIAQIDEDMVYAAIGAYDPEAFGLYIQNERQRLTEIVKSCDSEEDKFYREMELAKVSLR